MKQTNILAQIALSKDTVRQLKTEVTNVDFSTSEMAIFANTGSVPPTVHIDSKNNFSSLEPSA